MLDKDLKFAEKYNWWSKDKEKISKKTKLSYIMSKWNIDEIFFIFTKFNTDILKKWFELIKNDKFTLKSKRKSFLETLFEEKKEWNL